MPIDLSAPFRGSTAVAAGLLTPGVLRGRRYRRLFPHVFALRARAAGVLVGGRGVVAGYAAAELWGASCGPADAPIDVLPPYDRRCDGLRVHRERIDPDEITWSGPTPVTTADRAAFDLTRWAPDLTERVAAVDALAHCCKVDPDAIRALRNRHLGVHHGAVIAQVLALADAQAASPMEQGDEAGARRRLLQDDPTNPYNVDAVRVASCSHGVDLRGKCNCPRNSSKSGLRMLMIR